MAYWVQKNHDCSTCSAWLTVERLALNRSFIPPSLLRSREYHGKGSRKGVRAWRWGEWLPNAVFEAQQSHHKHELIVAMVACTDLCKTGPVNCHGSARSSWGPTSPCCLIWCWWILREKVILFSSGPISKPTRLQCIVPDSRLHGQSWLSANKMTWAWEKDLEGGGGSRSGRGNRMYGIAKERI